MASFAGIGYDTLSPKITKRLIVCGAKLLSKDCDFLYADSFQGS